MSLLVSRWSGKPHYKETESRIECKLNLRGRSVNSVISMFCRLTITKAQHIFFSCAERLGPMTSFIDSAAQYES